MLRYGRLEIDRGSREVRLDGAPRPLTGYQFALLLALAEHAGRVMSRDALMDAVKGEQFEAFDRSIDVHVSRIRAAIEDDPRKPRRVITVRGTGLRVRQSAGLSARSHLQRLPEPGGMRRLYLQVYLTIVASLVLVVLTAGLLWHFIAGVPPFGQPFEIARELIAELVPPPDAPPQVQQRDHRPVGAASRMRTLALFSRNREPLAAAGRPLPAPGNEPCRRVAANAGRPRDFDAAPRRTLAGRAHAASAHRPSALAAGGFSRGHRARGRARRAADRPAAHRTARAIAARRRVARRRRSARARQGRRPRRGRPPGRKASIRPPPASRAWSTRTSCCSPMRPMSCERRSPASGSVSSWSRRNPSARRSSRKTSPSSTSSWTRSCCVSRLDATERLDVREDIDLAALAAEECARYEDCSVEGQSGHGARGPDAAASHDPQPRRECQAPWQAADRGDGRAAG